jgi:hypothetical protein
MSTKWLKIGLAAVIITGICWAAAGTKLYLNGQLASTSVKVIDGRSYAPVADIAKALGATVQARPDGYEIIMAGGANQIEGVAQGKIGQELFTGKFRFQVVSVEEAGDRYAERYYQAQRTIRPGGAKEKLLVLNCRLKNGTTKTVSPVLTEREPGNTALADTEEHSYAPLDYDARQEINKTQSYAAAALLPGAATEFALVFSVPQGITPKALVFSIMMYPDDIGKNKFTNVRVVLSE